MRHYANDIVVEAGTEDRFRLLRFTAANTERPEGVWLIELSSPLALPIWVSLGQLEDHYLPLQEQGAIAPATGTMSLAPSQASIRIADETFLRIQPLVDEPGIMEPSSRHALLKLRASEPGGGTEKTLLKALRRWWQGGQTMNALLGHYANSGSPNKPGTQGRGRHKDSKYEEQPAEVRRPYQLTEDDLAKMREVIESYYFDKEARRTLQATLEELHNTHYTFLDGNGERCLKHGNECPSYKQLRHFLLTTYPRETILVSRKGEKAFAKDDRSTHGSIQTECLGPGHIYEFDATIVDVKLVSEKDRTKIVGKPTLYLIIDRFSRLIVGFYLGFEHACYTAAMQAILSLGEDWEALCNKLGLPYDPDDWPAQGVVPLMFLADQGELTSKTARRIARSLRSTLSNVPGLRPDWKPLVECGFKMLHQIIAPDTPAYTPDADSRQRRAVNRDREVCQTLSEFTAVIVAAIIAHNKRMQVGYPLSIEQAADGTRPIPRELWDHGVRTRSGYLSRADFSKVREELLPRAEATFTGDAIMFEKLAYLCPEALARGWLVQGRKVRSKVEIAHDFRLVNEILVYSPDGSGESFVAHLSKDSGQFEGFSLKEVRQHFHNVGKLTRDAPEVRRQAMFEYSNNTKPATAKAKAATKAAVGGKSRSGRPKDTAAARQVALKSEQLAKGGVRAPMPSHVPASAAQPAATTSAVVVPIRASEPAPSASPAPAASSVPLTLQERLAQQRRQMLGF